MYKISLDNCTSTIKGLFKNLNIPAFTAPVKVIHIHEMEFSFLYSMDTPAKQPCINTLKAVLS